MNTILRFLANRKIQSNNQSYIVLVIIFTKPYCFIYKVLCFFKIFALQGYCSVRFIWHFLDPYSQKNMRIIV